MDKLCNEKSRKHAGLLGVACGSLLIGLSAMPAINMALAMPRVEAGKQLPQVKPNPTIPEVPSNSSGTSTLPLNPRPSIFNESPYNRSQLTSPSNANVAPSATPNDQETPSKLPASQPASGTLQPPLPEDQPPDAMVMPKNGVVIVSLINQTGADITYQVVGNTNQRALSGKSTVTLRDLPTPVTVTFKRQDGGLLMVTPQASSESELLAVTFTETTDLGTDKSTMRIQASGSVYLY